jgi:hypothetical protein
VDIDATCTFGGNIATLLNFRRALLGPINRRCCRQRSCSFEPSECATNQQWWSDAVIIILCACNANMQAVSNKNASGKPLRVGQPSRAAAKRAPITSLARGAPLNSKTQCYFFSPHLPLSIKIIQNSPPGQRRRRSLQSDGANSEESSEAKRSHPECRKHRFE